MATNRLTGNSPFNVGVSGHRDLNPDDARLLRGVVTEFLSQLKSQLPDTAVRIIVGMAEGADLLVAGIALDLGLQVEAVLPMALDQYSQDFDPQNLALLRNLLARPGVHRLELSPGHQAEAHAGAGAQRDALYENLTHALIRRSSLMLALWDGNASRLRGGTADTVLRYLAVRTDGAHEDIAISFVQAGADMDAADRLVYWVPVSRVSAAPAAPAAAPCYLRGVGDNALEMQREMPAAMRQQLSALNHYNREYEQLRDAGRLGTLDSMLAALPSDTPLGEDLMLADIDQQYGKADSLAVYYQRRSDRLFILFGIMTFMMAATLLVYEHISESRVVLFGYMLILLSSLSVYYVLRGQHWFAKHLTYRAIAETMRAKFFLRLAGIDHRVDAAEVLGLWGIDRFRGFSWISYVLKGVEVPDVHAGVPHDIHAWRSRCVEQTWIDSQYRYFTVKVAKLERSARRIKYLARTVFVVILLVMASLILFGEHIPEDVGIGIRSHSLLTFLMEILAVLLGAWKLHQDKMATRELLWQYRNQLVHFTRARRKLACITSQRRRNDVLVELGKDSLMESYLWTIHRYHREHEPPTS